MRPLGIFLLICGLLGIVRNIRDEIRGSTTISGMGRSSASAVTREASKDDPKSNFRGAMAYHWIASVGIAGGGWFILSLLRHYDRHDLLSTKFESTGET